MAARFAVLLALVAESAALRTAFMGNAPLKSGVLRHSNNVQMSSNPDAPIKVGINGFGRIGRLVFRIAMERDDMVVKHINSPMAPEYMKYLLNYDSAHGRFKGTCELSDDGLIVNGLPISLSATRDPTDIPSIVVGVNTEVYDPEMKVVSCASCTTNGLAP